MSKNILRKSIFFVLYSDLHRYEFIILLKELKYRKFLAFYTEQVKSVQTFTS